MMRCRSAFAGVVLVLFAVACLWSGSAYAASASVIYKGPSGSKQIALTFDDDTVTAPGVATLRALQKYKVPATMFVIGDAVASTPAINAEILKGMEAGLFEVGDHSWSHPVLTGLSSSALAKQIGGGVDQFHAITGARTVPLFRPPYGSTNARVAAVAGSEGFRYLILWDIDPKDWSGKSASAIAQAVVSHAHSGAIVVMHLSAAHTAAAIPTIVSTLREKGYEFVSVSTMLKGSRRFLDVDESTAVGAAVARMVKDGYMSGYDGNYFGPTDTITRAQVAKVATLVGGLHTTELEHLDSPVFADVKPVSDGHGGYSAYPFDYVQEAAAAGLVVGSPGPDGTLVFSPNSTITRVQLATILARMARTLKGYSGIGTEQTTNTTTDIKTWLTAFVDVPAYATEDVALVAGLGLMNGLSSDDFGPWDGASRGQVALAMSRFLALASYQPGD